MDAMLLCGPKSDSSQQAPIRDNVVQVVFLERIKRRVRVEEELSMLCLGTTRLQVVDQSFAHFVGQRQPQWCTCFRLRDFYARIFPMKLIEFQCANVSNAQPQSACHQ